MRFVFLGPVFCLQLPSDSASPRTPLLLANLYFCLRGSGLPPYSSCACRAHIKKFATPPSESANFFREQCVIQRFIEKPFLKQLPYACDLVSILALNTSLYKSHLLQRLLLVYLLQQLYHLCRHLQVLNR